MLEYDKLPDLLYLTSFNYGGLNFAVFRKFHHIFISTRHNKTRLVNFWSSDMVHGIRIFWQSAIFLPAIIFNCHNITRHN